MASDELELDFNDDEDDDRDSDPVLEIDDDEDDHSDADDDDSDPYLDVGDDDEDDEDADDEDRGSRGRKSRGRRKARDDEDPDDEDEPDEKPRKRGGGALAMLRGRPKRPGEQDPMQSPLVMWLFGISAALILVSAILWLVIGRYYKQQRYDAAKSEMDARSYRQAIKLYDEFLGEYPGGDLAETARLDRAKARVLRHVDTATPNWDEGFEEFETFLGQYREKRVFEDELKPEAFDYAKRIALGTARDAERSETGELLPIHQRAAPLALRFAPTDEAEDLETALEQALSRAEAAIHRRETYDAAVAGMDQALAGDDPLGALDKRVALLDQFPDYADDAELSARFTAAMDAELARIEVAPVGQPGEPNAPADDVTGATLALHTRNSEDQPVGTRRVIAVAGGTLFASDATTGTPVWSRRIGVDQPFFPVETNDATPGLLVFDTRRLELVHLEKETGAIVWRRAVGERAANAPLIASDGLAYLVTVGGAVHQIDLSTGELIAFARCSQPLATTPTELEANRVVVAGDRGVAYVFATRPLAIESLVHLGHRPGTMADVLRMGPYVLTVENDQHDAARLRLFDGGLGGRQPAAVGSARVAGRVHDRVSVRGSQLVVPFGGEGVATFVVSAEEGKPPILKTAETGSEGVDVDSFLLPGPADEFWVASTALRRYRILVDTVQQVPGEAARGRHVQPIQSLGEDLFIGYQPEYASPVYLVRMNRRTFAGEWRTVYADRIAASLPLENGSLVCATESGQVYRLTADDLTGGGFVVQAVFSVPLGDKTDAPLRITASPEGIGIVGTDREGKVRLWVVNKAGVLDWNVELPEMPQLAPAPLAGGFVVAYPGRLSLVLRTRSRIDDYQANVAPGSETRWVGLSKLGDKAVVAQDSEGGLVKIEYVPQPLPHLSPTATVAGPGRVGVPFGADLTAVAVVDPTNTLVVHSANRFEQLASHPLPAAPARPPELIGNLVLVETRDHVLHGVQYGLGAGEPWTVPLDGGSLAGRPLFGRDGLVVVLRDGRVRIVDPVTGEVRRETTLPVQAAGGPMPVGDRVVVPTTDASLIPIDPTAGGAE